MIACKIYTPTVKYNTPYKVWEISTPKQHPETINIDGSRFPDTWLVDNLIDEGILDISYKGNVAVSIKFIGKLGNVIVLEDKQEDNRPIFLLSTRDLTAHNLFEEQ